MTAATVTPAVPTEVVAPVPTIELLGQQDGGGCCGGGACGV
jgi:hypothetical protein